MHAFVAGLRLVAVVSVAFAAICALAGFLVGHAVGTGTAVHGVGWGMTIGGILLGLLVGQSGSPTRTAAEGRWGPFGHYWGGSRALPDSPLWLLAVSALVTAGGIALVVLA